MKQKSTLNNADMLRLGKVFATKSELKNELQKTTKELIVFTDIKIQNMKEEIIEENQKAITQLKSDLFEKHVHNRFLNRHPLGFSWYNP